MESPLEVRWNFEKHTGAGLLGAAAVAMLSINGAALPANASEADATL